MISFTRVDSSLKLKSMLTQLDHFVLLTRDFHSAVQNYKILLGFEPDEYASHHGFQTALFRTDNTGLEIMAPQSEAAVSRAEEILGKAPSKLTSLAFGAHNLGEAHRILRRRGGEPNEISSSFRLSDSVCAGIKTFIVAENGPPKDKNIRLDHIVINTPNPDRAIAHYGARLGIRFALDRSNADWGARFLFFKLDDIVLELIHRIGQEHDSLAPDELWGLTWKVEDLGIHHSRLSKQGVTISEIRAGRKPGTQVFTVKSHTDNIPTLFLMSME